MTPDPDSDLSGKIALVTGGSRGLGLQMVRAFAERGADVIIASRKIEACEAAAEAFGRSAGAPWRWPSMPDAGRTWTGSPRSSTPNWPDRHSGQQCRHVSDGNPPTWSPKCVRQRAEP